MSALGMAAGLRHSAQGADGVTQQRVNFSAAQPGAPEPQWEMPVAGG